MIMIFFHIFHLHVLDSVHLSFTLDDECGHIINRLFYKSFGNENDMLHYNHKDKELNDSPSRSYAFIFLIHEDI